MARTKYKLGTFVKVKATDDAAASFGEVEGILMTNEGTKYRVNTLEDEVSEDEIEGAYRLITPRQSKTRTTAKGKISKKRESQAQAAA